MPHPLIQTLQGLNLLLYQAFYKMLLQLGQCVTKLCAGGEQSPQALKTSAKLQPMPRMTTTHTYKLHQENAHKTHASQAAGVVHRGPSVYWGHRPGFLASPPHSYAGPSPRVSCGWTH